MENNRILIIDDDVDLRDLLSNFLNKNGYDTFKATNGKEFLQLFEKGKFDLVLCDFMLPDQSGLEILEMVRSTDPACKFIIITGYSDEKLSTQAIEHGAYAYLAKPLHPDKFLKVVKAATTC